MVNKKVSKMKIHLNEVRERWRKNKRWWLRLFRWMQKFKRVREPVNVTRWQYWFAWYPVYVKGCTNSATAIVWLEKVLRCRSTAWWSQVNWMYRDANRYSATNLEPVKWTALEIEQGEAEMQKYRERKKVEQHELDTVALARMGLIG